MSEIEKIAQLIVGEKNDLNKISILLQQMAKPEHVVEAASVLRKVFKILILQKQMLKFSNEEENQQQQLKNTENSHQSFLYKKFSAFIKLLQLQAFSHSKEKALNEEEFEQNQTLLRILVELSRYHYESVASATADGAKLSQDWVLRQVVYGALLAPQQGSKQNQLARMGKNALIQDYLIQFGDLAVAILEILQKEVRSEAVSFETAILIIQAVPKSDSINFQQLFVSVNKKKQTVESLLKKRKNPFLAKQNEGEATQPPQTGEQGQAEQDLRDAYQNAYTKFIFAVMETKLNSPDQHLAFVKILNKYVLPNLPDPLLLADYLKSTFDSASEEQPNLQIASLSGLFVLMARHQLEYANYFQKLYSLINAKVFLCQESKRFLKMLDASLRSSKLPESLLASFIKKLLLLCLQLPPHAILWCISLTINLLKRNQALVKMIDTHKVRERVRDCFDSREKDVYKTNAHNSFLWELKSLQNHYLPDVGKMIKILGTNLEMANLIDLENFADVGYHHFIKLLLSKLKQKSSKQDYDINIRFEADEEFTMLNAEEF